MSYTYEITTAGKALVAKAQTGAVINFTKVEVGKGDLVGSPSEFTSLLDPVTTNAKIQQKEYIDGSDEAKITITYNNEDIDEGFYVKEIGLYANDPDIGEILFLYCYSVKADYLPPPSYASVEQIVNLMIGIDNASEVIAQILPETNVIRDNFYANSILKADVDSEPEALIIEEESILGRPLGGNLKALTPKDVRAIIEVSSLPYSTEEDYEIFRRVIGSDGNLYNCRKPNGPNLGGTIDPVGDTTYTWTTTEPIMAGELCLLTYIPTAQEKLTRRIMDGTGILFPDVDYPEILSKWGGKPFGGDDNNFYGPVLSGQFLRIIDEFGVNDPDYSTRTLNELSELIMSTQESQNLSHNHTGTYKQFYPSGIGSATYRLHSFVGAIATGTCSIVPDGGNQSNPTNLYVYGGIFV